MIGFRGSQQRAVSQCIPKEMGRVNAEDSHKDEH